MILDERLYALCVSDRVFCVSDLPVVPTDVSCGPDRTGLRRYQPSPVRRLSSHSHRSQLSGVCNANRTAFAHNGSSSCTLAW
eukprot:5080883-Prymnesium_polylepis.1